MTVDPTELVVTMPLAEVRVVCCALVWLAVTTVVEVLHVSFPTKTSGSWTDVVPGSEVDDCCSLEVVDEEVEEPVVEEADTVTMVVDVLCCAGLDVVEL